MSMIKFHPSAGQSRIQLDGAVEKPDGLLLIRLCELFNLLSPQKIVIISIQVFRSFTFGRGPASRLDQPYAAAQTVGDLLCDLGLDGEHIISRSVPTV